MSRKHKYRAWVIKVKNTTGQYFYSKDFSGLAGFFTRMREFEDASFVVKYEQYTGYIFCGTELYDGDLVETHNYNRITWLIEWHNCKWVINEMPWDRENEPANRYDLCDAQITKTIGNVWENENKNLLEKT